MTKPSKTCFAILRAGRNVTRINPCGFLNQKWRLEESGFEQSSIIPCVCLLKFITAKSYSMMVRINATFVVVVGSNGGKIVVSRIHLRSGLDVMIMVVVVVCCCCCCCCCCWVRQREDSSQSHSPEVWPWCNDYGGCGVVVVVGSDRGKIVVSRIHLRSGLDVIPWSQQDVADLNVRLDLLHLDHLKEKNIQNLSTSTPTTWLSPFHSIQLKLPSMERRNTNEPRFERCLTTRAVVLTLTVRVSALALQRRANAETARSPFLLS